jgi:hypothetical protein
VRGLSIPLYGFRTIASHIHCGNLSQFHYMDSIPLSPRRGGCGVCRRPLRRRRPLASGRPGRRLRRGRRRRRRRGTVIRPIPRCASRRRRRFCPARTSPIATSRWTIATGIPIASIGIRMGSGASGESPDPARRLACCFSSGISPFREEASAGLEEARRQGIDVEEVDLSKGSASSSAPAGADMGAISAGRRRLFWSIGERSASRLRRIRAVGGAGRCPYRWYSRHDYGNRLDPPERLGGSCGRADADPGSSPGGLAYPAR